MLLFEGVFFDGEEEAVGKRGRSQVSEKDSDVRDLPRVSSISGFRERLMNKKVALGDRLVLGLKERLRKEQVQEKKL